MEYGSVQWNEADGRENVMADCYEVLELPGGGKSSRRWVTLLALKARCIFTLSTSVRLAAS